MSHFWIKLFLMILRIRISIHVRYLIFEVIIKSVPYNIKLIFDIVSILTSKITISIKLNQDLQIKFYISYIVSSGVAP